MHLRFSFNSNNLNAQVNKLHNLKYWDYSPGLAFGGVLSDFGFTFRSSLSSVTLTWASKVSSSGSWMSSYVPSTSDMFLYAMRYSKLVKCLSIAFLH